MSTLVSFRRNAGNASARRAMSAWRPAETHHLAPEMVEGMGLTARFRSSRKAATDLLRDEVYSSKKYSDITANSMRIHDVKHVQGEWMLIFANTKGHGECMEINATTSNPQWKGEKALYRPQLLESGGGETMALWRDVITMPTQNVGARWENKVTAAEIRSSEGHRVSRVLFDKEQDRWVVYYDTSGLQYGEWVITGTSVEQLKNHLQAVYQSGRETGTSWYTVALECSPKGEWLMVMRGFSTSVCKHDDIRKESIVFLPTNDSTAAEVVRKAEKLSASDPEYRLRHLASDGKNTVMVAQSSKAFKSYDEVLHVVHSPEELRELVHGYLEKASTLKEHWEVGIAVDIQKPKTTKGEELKASKAREQTLHDKLSTARAESAQLKEEMKSLKLNMEKELNSVKRELKALKAANKPQEGVMFDKLRTSVEEAVKDVGTIGSPADRRKSFKNLKMQLHPDKHPSAFAWIFTEIFKMLPSQAPDHAPGSSKQGEDESGHRHKRRRNN